MFDDIKIELNYTPHQNYPSPVMMADYENDGNVSDATFYTNHKSRAPSTKPCRTGSCVRHYMTRLYDSTYVYEMGDTFSSQNATADNDLPQTINRDVIRKMMELTA